MKSWAAAALILVLAACGGTRPSAAHTSPIAATSPCVVAPTSSPSPSPSEESRFGVTMEAGQTVERHVTVPPREYTFGVLASWGDGQTVALSLVAPSGKVYDRNTTDPGAHHHFNLVQESFAIDGAEQGTWTIRLIAVSAAGVRVYINRIPLSDFAPDATIVATPDRGVAPATMRFSALVTPRLAGVSIISYHWDFGDCTAPAAGAAVVHTYRSAGNFQVVLATTDSNDEVGVATQDVTVTGRDMPPTATFVWALLDKSNAQRVFFDASESSDVDGSITDYAWSFGDGASAGGVVTSHVYAAPGRYAVRLRVTDNGGLKVTSCQLVTPGAAASSGLPSPASCSG